MTHNFQTSPEAFNKSGKQKKKIMKEFIMNELSAVDFGAQEPALAVLMKRNEDQPMEKLMLITSVEQGHSHGVNLHEYHFENGGGTTDYAGDTDDEFHHDHTFVINDDLSISLSSNKGHTHEISSEIITRMAARIIVQQPVNVIQMRSPLVKREAGKDFTAQDYALVENPERPETWKHRLVGSPSGNPSRREVGNAVKALERDQVPASKQASVIRRVRTAWQKCHPSSTTPMPSVLKRVSS